MTSFAPRPISHNTQFIYLKMRRPNWLKGGRPAVLFNARCLKVPLLAPRPISFPWSRGVVLPSGFRVLGARCIPVLSSRSYSALCGLVGIFPEKITAGEREPAASLKARRFSATPFGIDLARGSEHLRGHLIKKCPCVRTSVCPEATAS